ncbi:MAG: GNAT family N-acetyltransferase [Eubacterium sp.]|nr:GNAT family N-acetyltransferase [Eubacterium sp.]
MQFKIRLATAENCGELAQVKRKVWETTYRGIYPDEKIDNFDFSLQEKKFAEIIADKSINLYAVFDENGSIIGYMSCGRPLRKFKDYEQEIGLLYLLAPYQGNGLGKRLFLLANERIKNNGYNEFFISCNKYNLKAQKFYEKMGGIKIHTDEGAEDKSIPQVKYHYHVT